MLSLATRNTINDIKNSISIIDFFHLNCRNGQTICAPSFIRSDHNPSFTVWHNSARDWSTGISYDIFSLKMLRDNQSFPEAFQDITGQPLFPHTQDPYETEHTFAKAIHTLRQNITDWHANLLTDPIINFKGKDIHLLSEYLKGRGITTNTAKSMKLGYNPKTQRLIFPLFKNGRVVYFIGRDLTGNCEAKFKYVKAKLDDNPIYESTFWGRETLRQPKKKYIKTFTDENSGEVFELDDNDPRNFTLVICEGMLDYASFRQDGWQVITPGTIHISRQDQTEVLNLAKSYKSVCICFDNDKRGQEAAIKLGKLFFEHRIKFTIGQTHNPDGSDSKYDINDYYSHGGNLQELVAASKNGLAFLADSFDDDDALYDFLEAASRWASPVDMARIQRELLGLTKPNPDYNPNDPTDTPVIPKFDKLAVKLIFKSINGPVPEKKIAQEVLEHNSILYNYNDSFYEFSGGRWQPIPDIAVFQYASDRLGIKAGAGKCRNVVTHIKGMAGQWAKFDTQHVMAFQNGVLDLESGEFFRHSPRFMNTIILNYCYSPSALCIKWRRFIVQVTGGNKKLMKQLQKAAGYVLFSDNSLQKMFALFGAGANGKSVFTGVLEQVFGSQNCSNVRADTLNSDFAGIHLQGALANFSYETPRKLNGAEETLKAVVSGDPIMSAHKGIDAVSFTSRAKWFINLNNILETTDISWGFLRRLIFLPFNQTFIGNKANPNLTRELLEELPGIFNWAYEGYKMLRKDMSFEQLEESTQLMEKMMAQVNNTFSFFCEAFRHNAAEFLKDSEQHNYLNEKDIYEMYKLWCKDNNEKPDTKRLFLERLRVCVQKYRPDVVISEPQHIDGVRGRVCTYYFPEIIPDNEPDFFAERRDENGQFLDTSDAPKTQPEEVIEDMAQADALADVDVDAALETLRANPNINSDMDRLIDRGKKAYDFCTSNPTEWFRAGCMDDFGWAALTTYIKANPLAGGMINFERHLAEYMSQRKQQQ